MGNTPILLLLALGLSTAIATFLNESNSTQPLSNVTSFLENTSEFPTDVTSRSGRHIQIVEVLGSGRKSKRQIIKIPSDVSKVKLVRPTITVKQIRTPPQFNRNTPFYRGGNSRRPNNKKIQGDDYEFDDSQYDDDKKIKRTLKKFRVKEVSPQEFFADEEIDFSQKKPKNEQPVLKPKRKITKHVLNEYLANYEVDNRKERQKEEVGVFGNRYKGSEAINNYESAASSIHLKQVPAPNLFPMKVIGAPEIAKQTYHVEKPIFGKFQDENYIPGFSIKKLPTKGRQIQSIFSQQYTTHNPHVATNFGFENMNGVQYVPKGSFVDATTFGFPTTFGKYTQPSVAASDQIVTTLPVLTPGIQVIQPPQFKDVTVSHPSHPSRLMSSSPQEQEETSSQRATIRDILEQDCPFHETKGYCESPPRYPMQQIGNIVKKCSSFMEMMNTQPFDEPHEVYNIGKRADTNVELENNNTTDTDSQSSWARSSAEESTACASDITITEPGYAKEVISGRWFVIVQHPETTIQRIATDTCKNPGKPCGGLAGVKCTKLPNKSTRCIQRYTYQRLISWDPESPDGCPRIRLFRFPSACVCHLSI